MKNYLRMAYAWYDRSRAFKYLVLPLIFVVPTSLAAAGQYNQSISSYFNEHPIVAGICAFWPATYIVAYFFSLFLRDPTTVGLSSLMRLFEIIDDVVGAKTERFGSFARKVLKKDANVNAGDIFVTITQPERQYDRIVQGVWQYFRSELRGDDIKLRVALARMGDRYIDDFQCFNPMDDGPDCDVEELRVDNCCLTRAKQHGQLIIVPDVVAEGEKGAKGSFALTRGNSDDEGSILCYPIKHRNLRETPFVVSVLVTKKNYFKLGDKRAYEFILNKFAKRIALEYGLERLKGKVT